MTLFLFQSCKEKIVNNTSIRAEQHHNFQWTNVQSAQPEFTVVLPAELKPYEQVDIYAKLKGFVTKIYADRGSYVYKGQLLAQLEAPEIGEQFAARRSSAGTAYQQYLISKQTYQRLKEAARKSGTVATLELEYRTVYFGRSAGWRKRS